MIWLLLYIIPILLVTISVYLDMEKGETVGDYLRNEDKAVYIFTFVPVINIIVAFFAIAAIVYSLTKNIRK